MVGGDAEIVAARGGGSFPTRMGRLNMSYPLVRISVDAARVEMRGIFGVPKWTVNWTDVSYLDYTMSSINVVHKNGEYVRFLAMRTSAIDQVLRLAESKGVAMRSVNSTITVAMKYRWGKASSRRQSPF